ncbi:signal transduction histidine kinase [Pedobacter sp. AK017]|uniref:sensor histidine kinase n=1 Tax=Pedobacter sp. AK017 TaxID=2723073 RepID=UPI0016178D3E|nr:sensor histidine kinase [Pedobacter sp. AK017]MBB5436669.1 signal transduction histidine kinase [Pedobacter sp. AK017]
MRLITLLLFFLAYLNTEAQPIRLDTNLMNNNIGKQVTYFEDQNANLTLNQVMALEKAGKFTQGQQQILNLGNKKSAFWVKIDYLSIGSRHDYLIVDVPNIEHIDLYIPKGADFIHRKTGALRPSAPGVIATNNYIFSLPLLPENTAASTLWLRVKTNNILLLPIKMATSENFMPGTSLKNNLQTIYIGVLLTLFLFNIFLYFSMKDSTYLYYSLYVFSLGLYVVGYLRGYSYLFGDNFKLFINHYPHTFLSISTISCILFSKKFLNLKAISPRAIQICNVLTGLALIMFITSIAGFKSISATLAQYITISFSVVLWTLGLMAYKKGHTPAKYYILAWTFIAVTIIATVLSMDGVFDYHDYSFEFVPVGSTIELLLLAFALGDRYRVIINNERKAREENFILVQTQNQRLEEQVADRTLKLSESIVQLKASNAVKNKLFSIIAHDLRSPFNSLVSIFSLKDMDLLSLDELKMLLNENKKSIDTIHNTLNNLLYWAKSQMDGVTTQPSAFDLSILVEELVLVYAPLTQLKGITVELQLPEKLMVYADENQIQLVLRNLIDNAIKFTPATQSIHIKLTKATEHTEICISNNIPDGHELNIEHITDPNAFEATYGTGQEKGVGLGLHLCREYIKGNGSELKVDITGQQVSFSFQLPKAKILNTI